MTSPSRNRPQPTIILIPGYWLGAWAWDEVLEHLTAAGAHAMAMTLPGLDEHDPDRAARTLDDQAAAIRSAAAADGDVVLVAHSGANGPVSLVVDRDPTSVRRVVWVDSGPVPDGGAFAPELPEDVVELALPDFDTLGQQASLDGLSRAHLDRFRARAVSEPAPVARGRVRLTNHERRDVPTTLICCSMPSEQVFELAASGHPMFSEVARLTDVDALDLPTGHWPMWSRARQLAEAIHTAAHRTT